MLCLNQNMHEEVFYDKKLVMSMISEGKTSIYIAPHQPVIIPSNVCFPQIFSNCIATVSNLCYYVSENELCKMNKVNQFQCKVVSESISMESSSILSFFIQIYRLGFYSFFMAVITHAYTHIDMPICHVD